MNRIGDLGLLKMDFLGLSTLTLIQDALDEIKRTEEFCRCSSGMRRQQPPL